MVSELQDEVRHLEVNRPRQAISRFRSACDRKRVAWASSTLADNANRDFAKRGVAFMIRELVHVFRHRQDFPPGVFGFTGDFGLAVRYRHRAIA